MHYECSKRFAARRGGHPKQTDPAQLTVRAMTPPGQPENAATRSSDPRAGGAAALLSRWSQRWAASAVRHAVNLHALLYEHASGGRVRLRRCSMLPCPCVRRRRRSEVR